MQPPLKYIISRLKGGSFIMLNSKTLHPNGNPNTPASIIEIPVMAQVGSSPMAVELVKQGGSIAVLALVCILVALLTKLIEASK
jgi:hypothetical protein